MISRKSMVRFRRGSTSPQEIFYYVMRHEHNLSSKNVTWAPGEREKMEAQRQELCRIGAKLPRRPKKKRRSA